MPRAISGPGAQHQAQPDRRQRGQEHPRQLDRAARPGWSTAELGRRVRRGAAGARRLLLGGRGIDATDLNPADRSVDPGVDARELEARADAAEQALRARRRSADAPGGGSHRRPGPARGLHDRCGRLRRGGRGTAVRGRRRARQPRDLLTQAGSIQNEVAQRVDPAPRAQHRFRCQHGDRAEAARPGDVPAAHSLRRGVRHPAPLHRPNAAELGQALAASEQAAAGDPSASVTWFQRTLGARRGRPPQPGAGATPKRWAPANGSS